MQLHICLVKSKVNLRMLLGILFDHLLSQLSALLELLIQRHFICHMISLLLKLCLILFFDPSCAELFATHLAISTILA